MRKLTTILCSIAFALSGICLAKITTANSSTSSQVMAATMPDINLNDIKLPKDLTLDLQQQDSIRSPGKPDTVYIEKPAVKTKKSKKVRAPRRVKTKTVHVPVLYIATRMDNKEDSIGHDSLPIYKVEKVGKIDLKKFNSSIDINQCSSFGLCSFALHDPKHMGKYL